MANLTITNTSTADGVYEDSPLKLTATEAVSVILIEDVTMTMTAAKTRWADRLANQYTVTINVAAGSPFDLDSGNVISFATDAFNAAVVIDKNSVAVSGNTASNIDVTGGVLSLDLTAAIVAGTPTVITFNVYKAGSEPTP